MPLIVYLAMGFMELSYLSRKSSGGGGSLLVLCIFASPCEKVRTPDRCEFGVNLRFVIYFRPEMSFGLKGSSSMSTL